MEQLSTVWYRDHAGTISEGIVQAVRPESVHVYWPDLGKTIPMREGQLWDVRPDWSLDTLCECGCTFGSHSESGCIPHQVHRFKPSFPELGEPRGIWLDEGYVPPATICVECQGEIEGSAWVRWDGKTITTPLCRYCWVANPGAPLGASS